MKKRVLSMLLALSMVIGYVLPTGGLTALAAGTLEGAGTEESPWLISDAEDFVAMSELIASDAAYADDYYQMTNDIDFTGVTMTSIGKTNHFKGVLDGQNYEIKNLTLTDTTRYTGLFSYLEGATVKNVGIVSSTITGGRDFGAFAGYAIDAVFLNCYSKAVVTGTRCGGGFTGGAANTQFLNCYSTATVTATDRGAGGISATAQTPSVFDNVWSAATVKGTTTLIGIVVGYDQEGDEGATVAPVTMTNVYYYGDLNACGNYAGRAVTKLTAEELTDGTLLNNLNNGLKDDYYQWIAGDDLYPAFNLFQVALSGAGTEESPYIIDSAEDLVEMARIVNYSSAYAGAHYKMTASIDLSGSEFNGIGSVNTFTGTFDGTGHVLKNVSIDNGSANKVGVFYSTDGAVIKNLGVESGTIEGGWYVGALIGSAKNSTVLNCYNGATVIGYNDVGGLIGTFTSTSILNSFNRGLVRLQGKSAIGGLAGSANATTVKNSYNIGQVNVGTDAGNLIGWSKDNLVFENTYYNKEAAIKNQPIGTFQDFDGVIGMTKAEMQTEAFVETLNANLEDSYSSWEYGEDKIARLSIFEETARIDVFMASIEGVTIADGKVQDVVSADGAYKAVLYGSDNRNVIDLDGNVYQPLTTQKVLLILDVVDAESGEVVGRLDRNIEVVVEGKYADSGKNAVPNVVPGLREWYGLEGSFAVTQSTRIAVEDAEMNEMSVRIQTYIKDMFGLELEIIEGSGSDGDIVLRYAPDRIADLREEGYAIEIDQQIIIEAPTETGMLYGAISIMQIMHQDETHSNIPKGYVRDYPQYELRGGMIHTGSNYYPLDYIEEIGKYMSWYKLNTIEVNITANRGEFGAGFMVESKKYPALNNGVGEYVWSQDDYRQMQKDLKKFGVNVITIFNSPGHGTPFKSFASDIMNGSNDFDLANHYDESLALIKDVYDEFLDGEDPVFQNAIVHIGTDESTNTNENMRRWISDISQYLLAKDNVDKVAYWGNLNVYYGETEIDPENLVAQLWDYPDYRADDALADGFEIINSNSNLLYICVFNSAPLQEGTYFCGYADLATFYDTWKGASDFDTRNLPNPYNLGKGNYYAEFDVLKGNPKILGSVFCEWDRYGTVNDYNVLELLVPFIAGTAEKCWYGDTDRFESGEEFAEAFDQVGGYAAYANPRYRVDSKNSTVAAYDFEEMADGKVSDGGANGYDATVVNGSIVNENGNNVLALDGTTSVALPFKGIGYPYTVKFDIYLDGEQNQDAILFDCDHGIFYLNYEGNGVSFETNRYVHSFNVEIPTDEWVEVKITSQAPTYAGASTNTTVLTINGTDYTPTNITDSSTQTKATVLGTEEMFTGVNGYIDNLSICNKYNYDPLFDLYSFEGDGTEESPYLIQTATDLQMFSAFVNAGLLTDACFKVTADIDMTEVSYDSVTEFKGTLDGDGHKITNLTISEADATRVGLIGYLNGGTIKNLGIEDSAIAGSANVGAFAGEALNAVIMNCYSDAEVSGVKVVGGLVGALNSTQVYNCYSTAVVTASQKGAGGIAGTVNTSPNPNNPAALDNVYSAATVSGTTNLIGNICGYIEGVRDSYTVNMTNVYYYDSKLNACGNRSDINETELTEAQLTDDTLLSWLNGNLADHYAPWVRGNDGYPVLGNRKVAGVTLDKTEASVDVGEELTLIATVMPEDATDKTVTWTSSDESVATVVDGKVTAVGAGEATIIVTTSNGLTAKCVVTVDNSRFEEMLAAIKEAQAAAEAAQKAAEEARSKAEEAAKSAAEDKSAAELAAANAKTAEEAAKAAQTAAETAQAKAEEAQKAAAENNAAAAEEAKKAAEEAANAATEAANAATAASTATSAAASAQEAQAAAEAAQVKAEAAQKAAEEAAGSAAEDKTAAQTAKTAAEAAKVAAENAKKQAEAAKAAAEKGAEAAEDSNAEAAKKAKAAADSAADSAESAKAAADSAAAAAQSALTAQEAQAAAEKAAADADAEKEAAEKAREEAQKAAAKSALDLSKFNALVDLADITEEMTAGTTSEMVEELVAVSEAAREAILTAETEEAVAEALAAAQAEMEAITEILCAAEEFTDVDVNEWYHDAIDFVINEGMMSGNGDGTFAPETELSRAMLVQILYNIEGKPEVETEKSFSDVSADDWYYNAVMWAAENGIVLGNEDGTYAPNDNVTREQMVTILYRYAGSPEVEDAEITFADAAEVDDYAKTAVIWAVANEVVKGKGDNCFDPDGNSTRAETAQVMLNYFGA